MLAVLLGGAAVVHALATAHAKQAVKPGVTASVVRAPADGKISGVLILAPAPAGGRPEPFWLAYREYLSFFIGGLPQLPAQAPLMHISDAINDRKLKAGLGVSGSDALAVAKALAHDAVLCGTAKVEAGRYTVSLSLLSAATGKPIGSPFTLSGDKAELCRQMPKLVTDVILRCRIKLTPGQRTSIEQSLPPAVETVEGVGQAMYTPSGAQVKDRLAMLQKLPADDPIVATNTAQGLMDSGGWWVAREKCEQGIGIVEKLATKYQEFASPWITLSTFLINTGNYQGSAQFSEKALAWWPSNFRLLVVKHMLLEAKGDFEGSVKTAKSLTKLHPRSPRAWGILSESYGSLADSIRKGQFWPDVERQGNADKVISLYADQMSSGEKALSLDSEYQWNRKRMMWVYMVQGELSKMDKTIEKVLQVDPGCTEAYSVAIQSCEDRWYRNPAKQRMWVARLAKAKLTDGDCGPRKFLIQKLIQSGFNREAISQLEDMRKQFDAGHQPMIHLTESVAYERMGNMPKSSEEMKLGQKLADEASPQVHMDSVCSAAYDHLSWNQYKSALTLFDDILERHADRTPDMIRYNAACHWELGQTDEAVKCWNRILESKGFENDVEARLGLAVSEFAKGDEAKAKSMCREVLVASPDLGTPDWPRKMWHWELAGCPKSTGLYEDARRLIAEVQSETKASK